jgi:hypothetical protein
MYLLITTSRQPDLTLSTTVLSSSVDGRLPVKYYLPVFYFILQDHVCTNLAVFALIWYINVININNATLVCTYAKQGW